jgi:hypothetical protein
MVKDEWNEYRIKFQTPTIVRERNDEDTDQENKMNEEYYVHLL